MNKVKVTCICGKCELPTNDEMDKAIERYQKAKENGTLDEEFPIIETIRQ